jgi:hypothetical protein
MKLLRETIRKLITEAVKMEEDIMIINSGKLWLLARAEYDRPTFDFDYFYENNLLGMLHLKETDEPCHDALAVRRSAARKGWGPTLYDIVMELTEQPLINDRDTVSDDAKSMMRFYKDRRPDVEKSLLDNIEDKAAYPMTPDASDDCEPGDFAEYEDGWRLDGSDSDSDQWAEDPLAYAYNKSASGRAIEIESLGKSFVEEFKLGQTTLRHLGSQLFTELYD